MFDKQTFLQLIRFGIVGLLNTCVTLAVIYLLMHFCETGYKPANVAGYVAGLINSFAWSKWWVFRKKGDAFFREITAFILIFAVCYGLQFGVLLLLVEQAGIGAYVAQLLAMCLYTGVSFILNRCITFRKETIQSPNEP